MSLKPAATRLAELLGTPVAFAADCVGPEVEKQAQALKDGEVLLLENLRFHVEEEKNVPDFARQLAALAEVYVNDAFGTAHRAHASTEGITHFLSPCAAGMLMEKELEYLGKAVQNPARPYVAIVGGAKVSDKIELLENFAKIADTVLVGGAMAYTFLKAEGVEVGQSKVEDDKLESAKALLKFAQSCGKKFLLPIDHVVAEKLDANALAEVVNTICIPAGRIGLDIGPATRAEYTLEIPQFAQGTLAIAKAVAASSAISIVGGGDSVAAVKKMGVADKISHISTGGGASLEFLSGLTLPGVAALTEK
jgi:phosphoglycerate kinase